MTFRWKKHAGSSVLGLVLGRTHLSAVELRRSNGSAEIRASLETPLETSPFDGSPDAAGLALRKLLEDAGIRERHCIVALPPDLILTVPVSVPELPDADQASFLQIEAERGFPQNPEDLLIQSSIGAPSPSGRHATLLGVPRDVLNRLELVLKAAHLRPVALTVASASLLPPSSPTTSGTLALIPADSGLALQLNHAGAIAALRVIDEVFSGDPAHPEFDADLALREIRITLGQLPPDIRAAVRHVHVFGRSESARTVATALATRLGPLGLDLTHLRDLPPASVPFRLPADAPASPALALALAAAAAGQPPTFNFQPPRVSALKQFADRYASRRLAWAGAAAATLASITALAFLGQQALLWHWQNRWDGMKSQVSAVDAMQREIRLYRPWFDESCRSLAILRRLTEAFPEDGSVTAKSIEIRATGRVSCSGTARDTQAWLRMLDQMRNARGITDVQVEQVRGKSPLEFTFNFRWAGPGGS